LELPQHRFEEGLLVGVAVFGKILQSGADGGNFVRYVDGIRRGFLELILEEVTFELIVVDADGDDDDGQGVIVSGEAAGDLLGGVAEAADGVERVGAGGDEEDKKPGEGHGEEAAEFFGPGSGIGVVEGGGGFERS
jgi:hypothetical protein